MTKSERKASRKLTQRPYSLKAGAIGDACYYMGRAAYASFAMAQNLMDGHKPTAIEVYNTRLAIQSATMHRNEALHYGHYLP